MLAANFSTPALIVGAILAVFLAAGAIYGQFRAGVIRELRESLVTATKEIDLHKGIVERLQIVVDMLEKRTAALEDTNATLKQQLDTGASLVPFMRAEFDAFEKRIALRHRILAEGLPTEIRAPLLHSLESIDSNIGR